MSLSDISDLTDLSSSEDDVPLAKRTGKGKKTAKEYKITHVLRAPRTAQYTAKSLYDQIIDNSIDLEPEYQRDVVWLEEKQSGLIDSILRNYYIPPIIFAVTIQDDGSELRTCIDGKQRLTSIQRFIDGHIPHKDSFTNEKLWFKSTAVNARRKLLPQHLKTLFSNKQVVCVEYTGLDNDQEREIFQRVQLGVALTPAERLQALVGPWSTVIREIQSQALGEEGFEGYLDWGHARGRDFQCLATIGYLIESYPKITIPGTKTLEKWLQKPQAVSSQLRADLHETFRIFVTLARDKKYSGSLNRPTRVSPIEFVMIGVLIYLKRETFSLTQISSAVEKMRKDVRASHQDIRTNTRVTKHLTEFITKKIKVSELKSDGEGDKPAAQAIAKSAKAAKRRRPVYSDSSDAEPVIKSAKHMSPIEASKPSKKASAAGRENTNGEKKTAAATTSKASHTAKSAQLSMQTCMVDNPSSTSSAPAKQSTLSSAPQQPPRNPSPPPRPSTSNSHNLQPSSSASNTASSTPLTIQAGPTVKVESPRVNSPAVLSAFDRLAPIRAAKASLTTPGGIPSPVSSQGVEMRTLLGSGKISSQFQSPQLPPPLNVSQQHAPQAVAHQAADSLPPPPTSSQQLHQPSLQHHPSDTGQGLPIPISLAEALQSLRTQVPQLNHRSSSNAVGVAPPGQYTHPGIQPDHSMPSHSMPGPVHSGGSDSIYTSQGQGISIPTGPRNGSISGPRPNWHNQALEPYPTAPRSSTSYGVAPSVTQPAPLSSQQQHHPMGSTASGLYSLPQRPSAAPNIPSRHMHAEPLASSLSRSTSSGSAIQDGRRGSYHKERYAHPDDRWSDKYDRQDYGRDKRNWSRPR